MQETFVAGLKHADQYAGAGTERAWLLGILRRKIVDRVRRRSRAGSLDAGDGADDFSESLFDNRGFWKVDPRVFGSDPSVLLQNGWGSGQVRAGVGRRLHGLLREDEEACAGQHPPRRDP